MNAEQQHKLILGILFSHTLGGLMARTLADHDIARLAPDATPHEVEKAVTEFQWRMGFQEAFP